jgi:hypothetical protein
MLQLISSRVPSRIESAKQARRSIAVIRRKLLDPTPAALDECVQHFRTAIECVTALQAALAGGDSETPAARRALQMEVTELHRELAHVNALMRNASSFFAAWSRLVAPEDAPGYSASGRLTLEICSTMRVEG